MNLPIINHALSPSRATGGGRRSAGDARTIVQIARPAAIKWEAGFFAVLLVLFNLPLVGGDFSSRFLFHPGAVVAGEWWRLLSHPWVHVSWYHLILDAAAFFLAYAELGHWRSLRRLATIVAAGIGSLLTTLWWSPQVSVYGLCGLSGIAHGLTALASLEAARRGESALHRTLGWVGLIGTISKCVIEAGTGHVLFASWHLGSLGTPMAGAHLGGVFGALLIYAVRFSPFNSARMNFRIGNRL